MKNTETSEKKTDPNFEKIVSAADLVSTTIDGLLGRREAIRIEREELLATQSNLLQQPVPFCDQKNFLLEYIDAKGDEYRAQLKQEIFDFIHPFRQGTFSSTVQGKPLTIPEMDKLLTFGGESGIVGFPKHAGVQTQFVTPNKNLINDIGLYYFFGEAIKSVIAKEFDTLGIAYQAAEGEIGTPRAERINEIARIDERLLDLGNEDAQIGKRLSMLGYKYELRVSK